MNSTTLIWIVVAIIIVLVIAGVVIALVATARGRREHSRGSPATPRVPVR